MNNSFDVVDAVAKDQGGVATLFVKSGESFIRVSTNVKKDNGSRAIGTALTQTVRSSSRSARASPSMETSTSWASPM